MDDAALLDALTPTAEGLMERHLSMSREWFPHELVPWGRGRDFTPGEAWDPDEFPLAEAVRSALFVNLLTEDNLPYYLHSINTAFGDDDVWGAWSRRWTAEEHRHSIVLRDWLTVSRALDPIALERARMAQVSGGFPAGRTMRGVCVGLVYVTLQELATRISHRNTGRLLGDPSAVSMLSRVAADENLHFLFYRDLATEALEVDPSGMVLAIRDQVFGFQMPGTEIPNFATHAAAVANAGIYDFQIHYDQILVPVVLRHWNLAGLEHLSPAAEVARHEAIARMDRIGRVARRLSDQRGDVGAAI